MDYESAKRQFYPNRRQFVLRVCEYIAKGINFKIETMLCDKAWNEKFLFLWPQQKPMPPTLNTKYRRMRTVRFLSLRICWDGFTLHIDIEPCFSCTHTNGYSLPNEGFRARKDVNSICGLTNDGLTDNGGWYPRCVNRECVSYIVSSSLIGNQLCLIYGTSDQIMILLIWYLHTLYERKRGQWLSS